jgi:hypothetical protein
VQGDVAVVLRREREAATGCGEEVARPGAAGVGEAYDTAGREHVRTTRSSSVTMLMVATIARVLLDEVIARDGGRCAWCGAEPWRRDLTFEHVLPRSDGGITIAENGLVACRRCNRARGSRPVVAYVRALRDAGADPQLPLIRAALARMSVSERRRHRDYGTRQLALLARLV